MIKLEKRFEEFTPIICRLLARTGNRRGVRVLTDKEIADRCGLKEYHVRSLSSLPSWDGVNVNMALGFMRGCGINIMDGKTMQLHSKYLKRAKWDYLRKEPDWMNRWLRMINIQKEYYAQESSKSHK